MSATHDMTGRAALITGSTHGIGAAIAEAYAAAGADIVIHSELDEPDTDVVERCRSHGVEATYIGADLTQGVEQVVPRLFDTAIERFPHLDILVSNAGQHQGEGHFLTVDQHLFDRTQQLFVTVPYFLIQRFARHWVERQRRGCVIVTGSVNGMLAEPGSSCYDIAKGAQVMLVRTLAVELARQGVRVNGIAPGMALTQRTQWAIEQPERGDWVRQHTPNGLLPGPDCCLGAAMFLASDSAYHVHGQMLCVDGGISVWQFPKPPTSPATPPP